MDSLAPGRSALAGFCFAKFLSPSPNGSSLFILFILSPPINIGA